MKHLKTAFLVIFILGIAGYIGWDYWMFKKSGATFRPGPIYELDEERYGEYEPKVYPCPVSGRNDALIVYGIKEQIVQEIETAKFKTVIYTNGRLEGPKISMTTWYRKTPEGRFDSREDGWGVSILNTQEKKEWSNYHGPFQESEFTMGFDHWYETRRKLLVEMHYIDILSRWDGKNEIVIHDDQEFSEMRILYDIELNIDVDDELFYPPQ